MQEEEEGDWFIVRGHMKGHVTSVPMYPAPLVLLDPANQFCRPPFATSLYGRFNNGWAMLGKRTEGGCCM